MAQEGRGKNRGSTWPAKRANSQYVAHTDPALRSTQPNGTQTLPPSSSMTEVGGGVQRSVPPSVTDNKAPTTNAPPVKSWAALVSSNIQPKNSNARAVGRNPSLDASKSQMPNKQGPDQQRRRQKPDNNLPSQPGSTTSPPSSTNNDTQQPSQPDPSVASTPDASERATVVDTRDSSSTSLSPKATTAVDSSQHNNSNNPYALPNSHHHHHHQTSPPPHHLPPPQQKSPPSAPKMVIVPPGGMHLHAAPFIPPPHMQMMPGNPYFHLPTEGPPPPWSMPPPPPPHGIWPHPTMIVAPPPPPGAGMMMGYHHHLPPPQQQEPLPGAPPYMPHMPLPPPPHHVGGPFIPQQPMVQQPFQPGMMMQPPPPPLQGPPVVTTVNAEALRGEKLDVSAAVSQLEMPAHSSKQTREEYDKEEEEEKEEKKIDSKQVNKLTEQQQQPISWAARAAAAAKAPTSPRPKKPAVAAPTSVKGTTGKPTAASTRQQKHQQQHASKHANSESPGKQSESTSAPPSLTTESVAKTSPAPPAAAPVARKKRSIKPPVDPKAAIALLLNTEEHSPQEGERQLSFSTGCTARYQPRGLSNPGNLCFMNAVLQAFLACNSFCMLLQLLQSASSLLDSNKTPVLHNLAVLASEFPLEKEEDGGDITKREAMQGDILSNSNNEKVRPTSASTNKSSTTASKNNSKNKALQLLGGHPVSATFLYDLVRRFKPEKSSSSTALSSGNGDNNNNVQWEQEDAQEFLEWLVDTMHQELASLQTTTGTSSGSDSKENGLPDEYDINQGEGDDGWLTKSGKRMVKKQETGLPLSSSIDGAGSGSPSTLISRLIQGRWASTVTCSGCPPSMTITPFTTLQLDIHNDNIKSVADALDAVTAAEVVEDYRPPKPGAPPTEATKTVRIASLPDVLILHLCRFHWAAGSSKINRQIIFDPQISPRGSWLDGSCSKERGAQYELVATVTHHGKNIGNGHYTSDVMQSDGRWLRFDDGDVVSVKKQNVLLERPYLLFYQKKSQ